MRKPDAQGTAAKFLQSSPELGRPEGSGSQEQPRYKADSDPGPAVRNPAPIWEFISLWVKGWTCVRASLGSRQAQDRWQTLRPDRADQPHAAPPPSSHGGPSATSPAPPSASTFMVPLAQHPEEGEDPAPPQPGLGGKKKERQEEGHISYLARCLVFIRPAA